MRNRTEEGKKENARFSVIGEYSTKRTKKWKQFPFHLENGSSQHQPRYMPFLPRFFVRKIIDLPKLSLENAKIRECRVGNSTNPALILYAPSLRYSNSKGEWFTVNPKYLYEIAVSVKSFVVDENKKCHDRTLSTLNQKYGSNKKCMEWLKGLNAACARSESFYWQSVAIQ